jgi:BMFP domain-containing protein YqiC
MASDGIDKLAKTLAETLPQGLRSVRDDLEKNFRSVLQSGLGKLDLVTREEFEVQEAVLARSREKLDALEARLAEMESGPATKKSRKKKAVKKASTDGAKKKTTKKKNKKTARKKTGR